MTADEHEPQHVVVDVVDGGAGVVVDRLGQVVGDHRGGPVVLGALAERVDRATLRGGHEPGTRILRDARMGPLRERGDDRVLCDVLGERNVAHDAHECADEPRRLQSPDRLDRGACGLVSHGSDPTTAPPTTQGSRRS
jgi:hypothetical protein